MNPARTSWPKEELLASVKKAKGSAKKIMWRLIRGHDHYEVAELFGISPDEVIQIVWRVINSEDLEFDEEYRVAYTRHWKKVPPMEPLIEEEPRIVKGRRGIVLRKKHYILKNDGTMTEVDDYSRIMMLSVRGFKAREIAKMTGIPINKVYRYRHKIRHGKR